MARPLKPRCLNCKACVIYFKPQGIPMRALQEVTLKPDEFEAIKLSQYDDLTQTEAAKKMEISQPTFARILDRANKKIAKAVIEGKAIKIEVCKNNRSLL